MKIAFFTLALSTFYLCSCKQNDTFAGNIISLDIENVIEGNLLESMQCDYIKLETTSECYICGFQRIIRDNNLLFILDNKKNIFEFDIQGHFIRKIGSKGGAKNEYIRLMDIFLDKKEKSVNVIDFSKKCIVKYDYDGKYIGRKQISANIFSGPVSFEYRDQTIYGYNSNWAKEAPYNFTISKIGNEQVVHSVPYPILGKVSSSKSDSRICARNNDILAVASFSDTIYHLAPNGATPYMCFNGPLKKCKPSDFDNLHPEFEADLYRKFLKEKKTIGLSSIYATDSIITFQYGAPIINLMLAYNLNTLKGTMQIADNSFPCSIVYSDNECFIAMKSIEDCRLLNNSVVNELISDDLDGNNPILAIYHSVKK